MRDITNIDLFCILKELKSIEGSRLKKIYQHGPSEFRLRFSTKSGTRDLAIILPKSIHLTKVAKEVGEPPTFVMLLRKHLEGRILKTVGQPNMDRIVVFEFPPLRFIVEMMGKGNVILTDENGKVAILMRSEETKRRKVKRGERYHLPEMAKLQPSEADKLKEEEPLPGEKVTEYIQRVINLPPFYIKEICARAKISPEDEASKINSAVIIKEIREFWEETQSPSLALYENQEYSVVKLYGRRATKEFPTLSELLDEVSEAYLAEESKRTKETAKAAALEKIQRKLEHQEVRHKELLAKAAEMKATGNVILKNQQFIKEMIETANSLRKSGKEWEEIERELNRLGKKVRKEGGKIVIEWR